MERTRIVHYTNSPTPVIISPTSSTHPRLSSSSSLSSLVSSCVDEKAPLASIDPENPSRRSSKSSDKSSRSSSTGRLFDNAKLGTSVYTAVRCQDYAGPPTTPTLRRDNRDVTLRTERPSSALPCNGVQPNSSVPDENRRHTLGTWSRSRRKPQNESPNSSFHRNGSSTLPRKLECGETGVSSNNTLVKPRKRYTWLSPKQIVPQGTISTSPLREHNAKEDAEKGQISHRVSDVVTCNLRTNPASPASMPGSPRWNRSNTLTTKESPRLSLINPRLSLTNPRLSLTNPVSTPNSPRLHKSNSVTTADRPRFNQSNPRSIPLNPRLNQLNLESTLGNPRLNTSTPSPKASASPRLHKSNSVSTADRPMFHRINPETTQGNPRLNLSHPSSSKPPGSPCLDPRSQSGDYDWKTDPRRKPCLENIFDISPPNTPPQIQPILKLGSKGPSFQEFTNGSANSDTGYSSSSTSENTPLSIIPPNTNHEDHSNSSYPVDMSTCSRNVFSHSPNPSIHNGLYVADESFDRSQGFIADDKTPVRDISQEDYAQTFPTSKQSDLSSPVTPTLSKENCAGVFTGGFSSCNTEDDGSAQIREIDSNGVTYSWSKVGRDTFILSRKDSDASNSSKNTNSSAKNSSSDSSHTEVENQNNCFNSARNRKSFRMAVGMYDSWCEINPDDGNGSVSNLDNPKYFSRDSVKSDSVFPIQESDLPTDEPAWREGGKSKEDDIFVSCDNLSSSKCTDRNNGTENAPDPEKPLQLTSDKTTINGTECSALQGGTTGHQDDTLGRRIKRNSMRLATASLSDLTCVLDDIDIGESTAPTIQDTNPTRPINSKTPTNASSSPISIRTNLTRTGSLLSSHSQNSSFGSFYSCQSVGAPSVKNSPASNGCLRNELKARLDSPSISRHNAAKNTDSIIVDKASKNSMHARVTATRTSSTVSTTSSSKSSHRQRPTYYWTRQTPYPRLLFSSCISGASSKGSMDHAPPSPQPSTTSSIYSNSSLNYSQSFRSENSHSEYTNRIPNLPKDRRQQQQWRASFHRDAAFHQEPKQNSSSSRPMTLPLQPFHYTSPYDDSTLYTSDLTPTSEIEYFNSDTIRSPPSLGRPKRKQYAGFDSQPLPMDSFLSDSSSVYTGVSCSSRNTDMTGQPDNGQFDESFVSEDMQSNFEGDSRADFSFDAPESLRSHLDIQDVFREASENESKRSSIHSTSTTKQGNGDTSLDEKDHEINSSFQDISFDDFNENTQDCITPKYSKFGKQFGPEYDAIFRLYKSDDVIRQDDPFAPPAYRVWSENGKALSSSCLLRSKLYSKRRFLSTRDIFDLMRNSDRTGLDGTVSLTSLEHHAHKVCEAILRCDEMGRGLIGEVGRQRHSLV